MRAWTVALLALGACSAPAACEDPATTERAWTRRVDSCPGVRLSPPHLGDCWQLSYASDGECEAARNYRCPNGITITFSRDSSDWSGYYVVRDEASRCETRWETDGA